MLPGPGEIWQGRYRVDERVGEGGHGVVYRVVDELGDRFALKILNQTFEHASADLQTRFYLEIDVLRGLTSPHTVRLFDSGRTENGQVYAVFEFLEGEDLQELLDRRGTLAESEVEHIIRQLLEALDEAHRAGVLHRDIKPQNIRIVPTHDDPLFVKLLDFGIAKSVEAGHPSVTSTGELVGTPAYMAPEQLLARKLSAATDLHSLGLVARDLLCGPRDMSGLQLERLRPGFQMVIPREACRDKQLRKVLNALLRTEVHERPQTAAQVLKMLEGDPTRLMVSSSASQITPVKAADPRKLLGFVALTIIAMATLMYAFARPDDEVAKAEVGSASHDGLAVAAANEGLPSKGEPGNDRGLR